MGRRMIGGGRARTAARGLRAADCGLRAADGGLRAADYGLRIGRYAAWRARWFRGSDNMPAMRQITAAGKR